MAARRATLSDAPEADRRAWRERQNASNRAWAARNADQVAQKVRREQRARYGTPKGRLYRLIMSGMRYSLINRTGGPWEALVGYTAEDLRRHLERRFQPGMSRLNYGRGGWVIDHRRPHRLFDYETPDDPAFRSCWALDNLQPLWERQNIAKGSLAPAPA